MAWSGPPAASTAVRAVIHRSPRSTTTRSSAMASTCATRPSSPDTTVTPRRSHVASSPSTRRLEPAVEVADAVGERQRHVGEDRSGVDHVGGVGVGRHPGEHVDQCCHRRAEAAGSDPVLERLARLDGVDQLGQPGEQRSQLRQVADADQRRPDAAREVLGQQLGPAVDATHRTLRGRRTAGRRVDPERLEDRPARAAEVQGSRAAVEHEPVPHVRAGLAADGVGVERR